jgi:hypothetical protein
MLCPQCRFEQPDANSECPKCGIVFAKYRELQAAPERDGEKHQPREGRASEEEKSSPGSYLKELFLCKVRV